MKKSSLLSVALATAALIAPAISRADYSNTVMSFNPIGYWPLNETNQPPAAPTIATNLGSLGVNGNGRFGGVAFALPGALPGDSDKAADLSGATVTLPYQAPLTVQSPFSAEGWFNPNDDGTFECCLSLGELNSPRSGWLIYKQGAGGGWDFRMYDGNGATATIDLTGGDVTPGVWHHVVVTWDGLTASLYVDGQPAGTATPSGGNPAANTDGAFTIGTRSDNAFKFPGGADEVALYTNLLSPAEVLAHYQNGTNHSPLTAYKNLVLTKNPLLYFRLDEGLVGSLATMPVATNRGSLGPLVNGIYYPGTEPGGPGPSGAGFGANNYSTHFVPARATAVDCGTNSALDIGMSPMTLLCWFKGGPTDFGNRFQSPIGRSDASWRMDIDWNGIARFVDGSPDCVGSMYANDNVWHFYAGIWDGAQQYVYIDGQLDGTINGSGGTDPGARLRLGGVGDYEDRYFNGSLAQVAVFTNALSPVDIQTIYAASGEPISILTQPTNLSSFVGLGGNLSIYAVGATSYQWQKNGSALSGQTGRQLSFSSLALSDAADYRVILSNTAGSVTSAVAHVTVSATAPSSLNLSGSLVLHLKFDGDAIDYSGHGNNGTLVGGPTYVTGGIVGSQALHYSTDTASTDFRYVTLGVRPDLQFSSNVNFTIAYWIRYPIGTIQGGDLPVICNALNSSYNPGYVFFQDNGNWGWTLHGTDPNQINIDNIGTNNPYSDGNWHHFAITADRTGLARTYLDGSEVSEKPIGELPSIDTTNAATIGQDPSGTYGVDGAADIADVGMWRRLLSQSEIASIYVAGASNHVSFVSTPLPLTITRVGAQVQLTWPAGILQSATSVTGPYTDVTGATSPYTTPASAARAFYRLRQ